MVYFKYLKFMLFYIFLLKPVLFALILNESNVDFVESTHYDGTDIDHELTICVGQYMWVRDLLLTKNMLQSTNMCGSEIYF